MRGIIKDNKLIIITEPKAIYFDFKRCQQQLKAWN